MYVFWKLAASHMEAPVTHVKASILSSRMEIKWFALWECIAAVNKTDYHGGTIHYIMQTSVAIREAVALCRSINVC